MASYSKFLGRPVTVSYRVGDLMLPASGTFVGDSGRSIFLEQHVEQRGRLNYFRWEIPYQYIHRIAEIDGPANEDDAPAFSPGLETALRTGDFSSRSSSFAAKAASGGAGPLSLAHRPKTT